MTESSVCLCVDMQRYESAMSWRAHDGEVYSVEFSYDENTVFSIGEDGKVCVCVLKFIMMSMDILIHPIDN